MFLWRYPSGHPAWELPSALSRGARTFLDLASGTKPRPPGGLATFTVSRRHWNWAGSGSIERLVGQGVGATIELASYVHGLKRVKSVYKL